MASAGGVVGSQPQEIIWMLPSVKMLLAHAKPEPGGGSLTVGEEFAGAAAKRVNLSPAERELSPENFTVSVPPRSNPPLAVTKSELSVVPPLVISRSVSPRN